MPIDDDSLNDESLSTGAIQKDTQSYPADEKDASVQRNTGSSRLEVRCPNCHAPTEVAVDTSLTDLTCGSCGSHFSLVDQSKATRMAPPLSQMGRFELIERLGIGGFGSVWKARDKQLDRTVAIKVPRQALSGDEQEKFFREARAAAQLRHPSIVSVHEVGRDGDSVYIVSDFVRGVTLGDWLTGQQLTSREAAELCAEIADALHHAHEQGVVHRDLKPANIMMDYGGQPHLMDFGLARRESGEVSITVDGQVLGTPAYMSPEQAQGEAHTADRRSDVYSLGVILFQLLTGELPFRGNARMLVKQVIQDEPPSPRKLNANIKKDLETITLKCLEKDPPRRFQSALELSGELRRFLAGEPILARPIGKAQRGWRWCRRNPLPASLAAAVVALMATAVVIMGVSNTHILRESAAKQSALKRAEVEATNATAISSLLQDALQSANPDAAKGTDYTVRQLLDDISNNLGDRLREQPEAEATLRATIGNAYRRLHLLNNAEPHLRAALNIRKRVLGTDHPAVAQSLLQLAWYYRELHHQQESTAEQLLRQALTIHRKLQLENSDTMAIRSLLHLVLTDQQRYEDAELVFDEATAIANLRAVPDGEFAIMLSNAGAAAVAQSDPVKGERLCRRAIEVHHQLHAEDHPEYAWACYELGNALLDQNKLVEAEASFSAALASFRKNFDDSYYGISDAMTSLHEALTRRNDQQAMDALQDAIVARLKKLQAGDSDVGSEEFGYTLRTLAVASPAIEGDIGRKEAYLDAAARIFEKVTAENGNNVRAWHYLADTHRCKGSLYAATNRPEEAERSFRRAIELFDEHAKQFDVRPVHTGERMAGYLALASLLASTDRPTEAEVADLYRKAAELVPDDAVAKNYLAWWLATNPVIALQNPQKAVELAQQAVDATPHSGSFWNTLGVSQYRAGDFTKSIYSLEKSEELRTKGTSDWDGSFNWFFLAMSHWQLDHKDEARTWYDQAIVQMEKTKSKNSELDQIRAEAAALLGVGENAASDSSSD